MLRLALFGLLAALAAVPPASAQTQMEMNADACAARDAADRTLNTAYQDALAVSDGDLGRRRLRDAQRAWVRFRDAEVASLFPLAPGQTARVQYGSIYPMRLCSAQARLTAARAAELRHRADCPVGEPCGM